jgi:sortase A
MEGQSGSGTGSEPTTEQESWFVRPPAAGRMDPGVRHEGTTSRTKAVDERAEQNGTPAAEPVGREVEHAATAPHPLPRRQRGPSATAETVHPEIGPDPFGLPTAGTPKADRTAPPSYEQSAGESPGSRESAGEGLPPARGPLPGEPRTQDTISQAGMAAGNRPERAPDPFNALDIREWFRDTRATRPGAESGSGGDSSPTDPTEASTPEASVPVPRARRRSLRAAVAKGVGEILVTLGLVILLFCVYQLFYTNLESNRAQAKIKNSLERGWQPAEQAPDAKPVRENFAGVGTGQAFALMHIPRLGLSWEKPILEGVSLDELSQGLGHYPKSAMPGKIGNFAVAGHRATHGEPFRDLNKLRQGDVVIVETENNWYRYVIDSNQIVDPTDVEVVLPVPNHPGVKPTEKLITLTTCNPRWASTERLIYWGHLDSVMSKAAGTPAELRSQRPR